MPAAAVRLCFLVLMLLSREVCIADDSAEETCHITVSPLDAYTEMPVENARISVADSLGNVLCDSLKTRKWGNYRTAYERVEYYTSDAPVRPLYIISIKAKGYEPKSIKATPDPKRNGNIYLGEVYLHAPKATKRLNEVTVTATKVKMVMKGDTIEYDATAFQLPEGSMLDALIAELPGATLDNDGRISVNGQFVSALLVNGRRFFKGDPQVALRNLPSYTVKNVQVYRQAPEEFRDRNIERDRSKDPLVMDVNLKRQYLGGWIANAEGGAGSPLRSGRDARWMGRLFAMRYDKYSYIAFHAAANNLNDPQRAGNKGQWTKPATSAGETTTKRAGIEFNTDWHDQSFNGINTTFNVVRQTTLNAVGMSSEKYLAGGNTFSRSQTDNDRSTWQLQWHGEISRRFSDIGRIWFGTDVRYDKGTGKRTSSSAQGNSMLPDNFTAPGTSDFMRDMLYQRQQLWNVQDNNFTTYWQTFLSLYCVKDHSIGIDGNGSYSNIKRNSDNSDRICYPDEPEQNLMLLQRDANPSRSWDYSLCPHWHTYGIKLGGKTKLNANANYKYTQKFHYGRRTLEEQEEQDGHNDNTAPSMAGSWLLDNANSYRTTRRTWTHELNAGLDFNIDKLYLNLGGSVTYDIRHLNDFRNSTQRLIKRDDWVYTGSAGLGTGSRWERGYGIDFNYDEEQPDIMQLLDVRDSSDPLSVSLGNAGLRKSNRYRIGAYITNRFGRRQSCYTFEVQYSRTDNAIAMARTYDRTTGVTTWQPRNINGNWYVNGDFHYDSYLDRHNRLTLSNSFKPVLRHSVDFSSDNEVPERVAVDGWTLLDKLTLKYSFTFPLKLSAKADFAWNRMNSCNDLFTTFSYTDINYGLGVQYTLPLGIELDTDIMAYCRRGYGDQTMNTTDWVWNLQLSKTFGRAKQWTVKAIGFDLLQQLPTIKRVVNAQGRTETRYNSQPSYAIVTLTYRLDIKPRKKQ